MRFAAAAFSFIVSTALVVAQTTTTLTVNTPSSVYECLNTQLTWVGGKGPFQILIINADQPTAAALEDLGSTIVGSPLTWFVKERANTRFFVRLRDTSSGQTVESGTVTVQANTDPNACAALTATTATASATGSTPPAAGTTTATSVAGTPPTTTLTATQLNTNTNTNTSTKTADGSNSSKTTSGASTSSTKTGGASQVNAPVALAGAAAFVMAVFA